MSELDVKEYVESKFKVDIVKESRKRNVVYARAIYAKLCKEHLNSSYKQIGSTLNKKHETIMYYCKTLFNQIKEYEKEYYLVYLKFKDHKDSYTDNEYNILFDKYIRLQEEFKNVDNRFNEILSRVPEDKLDIFYFRIKPIAKMLNSHFVNK